MDKTSKIGSPEEEVKSLVKLGLENLSVGHTFAVTDKIEVTADVSEHAADLSFEVKF